MNIKKYASVPKLVEISLDAPELLERYGEAITFHTYDVVGMNVYFQFFNARSNSEFDVLNKMMKSLILDANGKPVLADDEDLPIDIAAAAVNRIGEILGKSQSKTSTSIVGSQVN
jgi:hypothetical protein